VQDDGIRHAGLQWCAEGTDDGMRAVGRPGRGGEVRSESRPQP
jgi:hypothetical protein